MNVLTPDGIKLYVEEVGDGSPIIFVHEFAGDHRSWGAANALLFALPSMHNVRGHGALPPVAGSGRSCCL